MMTVQSVLVAGHLCIDITPELSRVPELVPGQLYEIGSAQLTLGGCVANTGLALAIAGVPTHVCGMVGNDPLGEIIRRLLAEHRVNLEDVTTTAGAATSYTIVLQLPDHDRTFWHHAGANAVFTGHEVNLDGVDILHLGYPPLLPALLTDDAAPLLALLKEARGRQITTSVDLAVVDRRSRAAEVDWRRVFARIMPYVDIATPSIDDLTSSGRGWMRRRRGVGGCARSVRGQRWRRSARGGRGRSLISPVYVELDSGVGTGGCTKACRQHDRSGRCRQRRTPLRPSTRNRH
jgi:sugar/nucleoside kinase (ribokinase family)